MHRTAHRKAAVCRQSAQQRTACGSMESNPPFPFPPRGKPGRGKVPPTREAFAPLAPSPDQSQPMSPSEDDCAWEKIKGGRHVGLDFYDLLIEVTMLQRATAGQLLKAIWNWP